MIKRFYSISLKRTQGRIIILGSGWAGFQLMRSLDQRNYEVVVVSPRNYFLFTPLLASTCVGTLEFRCITEPIRAHAKELIYYESRCDSIDFAAKTIECSRVKGGERVSLSYDKLVVACGAVTQTFGIPGVTENAFFLKDINDARRIRTRVIDCFERASQPDTPAETQRHLLHFAVVGGGPTGVEFSAELHDFITEDLARLYPELMDKVNMSLFDVAPKILTSFDSSLSDYATSRFKRKGIVVRTGSLVDRITPGETIHLKSGQSFHVGLIVWATGLAPNPLINSLRLPLDPGKRVLTDAFLRVLDGNGKPMEDVYALGDCATIKDGPRYPATAQVANQKAIYLSKSLNKIAKGVPLEQQEQFQFHERGTMAYVGGWRAIMNVKVNSDKDVRKSGPLAWLFWRSAYFTMSVSFKNKVLIPMYWFLTWIFGRDTTKL